MHDASGINNWEDLFSKAAQAIGLPDTETSPKIPFDLSNKTSTLIALEVGWKLNSSKKIPNLKKRDFWIVSV